MPDKPSVLFVDDVVRAADVVISIGCGDARLVHAGKRYLDRELDNSAELSIDAVRAVRDTIDSRVVELRNELVGSPAHPTRRSG